MLYVARGGIAEARILWRRQPITTLLARPDLAPDLRERLELVLSVRRFADESLGLHVGESYETYADVEGAIGVWVVSAARRDRLEAYTWWFPIVGSVPYKGFFARADADAAAKALEADGFDVQIRPASAFSTLGWFADPLLSTTVRAEPVTLAETVFHEIFHATLYLPGEAPFNESAATFVGNRAAIAFFCSGPAVDAKRCALAREHCASPGPTAAPRAWRRLRARAPRAPAAPAGARRRAGLGASRELVGNLTARAPSSRRTPSTRHARACRAELDAFDRLARDDAALAPAIRRLVERARAVDDPFTALRELPVHDVARTD
jgi:hypothetical protein